VARRGERRGFQGHPIARRLLTRRFAMTGFMCLLGVAVVAVAAFGGEQLAAHQLLALVFGILTCLACVHPLWRRASDGRFDVLEPIVGASAMLLVLFGIRPISMVLRDEAFYHDNWYIEPYLGYATFAGLIGTVSFMAAYEWACRQPETRGQADRIPFLETRLLHAYTGILFVLGVVLFALHLRRGGSIVGTLQLMLRGRSPDLLFASSEYLSSAPILASCAAILLIAGTRRNLSLAKAIFLGLAITYPVAIFLLSGARRFIVPTIAIPVIVYCIRKRIRPSRLQVGIGIPVAFALLAIIPHVRAAGAREAGGGVMQIVRDSVSTAAGPWTLFIEGPDTEMVGALAVETAALSELGDFYYGRATFGDLLLAPIPSVVFPGKPMTARNSLLTQAFGQPCVTVQGLCPDFSVIGTFYQDFSYPGVVLGMLALGVMSARIWRLSTGVPASPVAIVTAACWIVFLPILIRAGFMPAFGWFLYFAIPSVAGMRLASRVLPRERVYGRGKVLPANPRGVVHHANPRS
jgi:hypothetical protein